MKLCYHIISIKLKKNRKIFEETSVIEVKAFTQHIIDSNKTAAFSIRSPIKKYDGTCHGPFH